MFRAIVFQRSNLNAKQIADIPVVSASIKEDLTQKATSKIELKEMPSNVSLNDLIQIYDNTGIFIYWGIITNISDTTITCSQFQALFNDTIMLVAQTSTNQKNFYKNGSVSSVVKFYLDTKVKGYGNIVNSMSSSYVPTYSGLLDKDVADNYKGITFNVTDSQTDHMPYPLEVSQQNLESFLYDTFSTYSRIIRPHFSNGSIVIEVFYPTGTINGWDYNEKKLFDTWECISDSAVTVESEKTNTVYVYSDDGTTLRGAYTIKNTGEVVQITANTNIVNRLGSDKTTYVLDSTNKVADLVSSKMPSLQYNHKITFNISFGGEYGWSDFNLGQPIKFYSSVENKLYDTMLTAWSYSIKESTDKILNASFTLGKVRNNLTSKLNKKL